MATLPGGGGQAATTASTSATAGTRKYPFYPMAGNLGRDIFVVNYADMDTTAGIKAYDCTSHTYNGHDAHDTTQRGSFTEQDIGIPIYAALDGYVTRVSEDQPDKNTSPSGTANYVQLYHGGGHVTGYLHMKKGSVGRRVRGTWITWAPGDFVKAGTQIGLMASSGGSYGPHLHFSSHRDSAGAPSWNGSYYEPNSGACNAAASQWETQVNDPTSPMVHGFTFSPNAFTGTANPPYDQAVRTGVFASGVRQVNMRADLAGVAAGDSFRIRFIRPDNTVASDNSGTFANQIRGGFHTWSYSVNLNVTGTWKARLDIKGVSVLEAPFAVNATGTIANRAPIGVTIAMDPKYPTDDDVVFCRIVSNPALRDVDYQLVRYRWEWKVNGVTVRDVVTAARSDAIPHHTANNGDSLSCKVTPRDGITDGPSSITTLLGVTEGDPDPELSMTVFGGGTVTSTPAGIACPGDCYQRYEPRGVSTVTLSTTTETNQTVTLKATPKSRRWRFRGWGGACETFGKSKTCTIDVSQSEYATATFKRR